MTAPSPKISIRLDMAALVMCVTLSGGDSTLKGGLTWGGARHRNASSVVSVVACALNGAVAASAAPGKILGVSA
ncbi:hypothetical protein GCM10009673_26430 [Nesterenkonia sandarakina]